MFYSHLLFMKTKGNCWAYFTTLFGLRVVIQFMSRLQGAALRHSVQTTEEGEKDGKRRSRRRASQQPEKIEF